MSNHGSSDRNRLHVIKASAGSGKTHRLTGEYLTLLFSGQDNHRHILAVTFTNKATDEMKSRIVEELHRLASGNTSSYLRQLMADFSLSEERTRTKAKSILEAILHDYSSFSISTIDRFFQQTLRAFTRESGLSGGYAIELDETSLLTETIDLMLAELNRPENKILSEWLLRFMQNNIEEGRSWQVDRQVLDLAKQLFNETYKSFSEEEQSSIRDKEQLEAYRQTLVRVVKSYENEVKNVGARAVALMETHGVHPSDFTGGSRSQFFRFSRYAAGEIPEITKTFLTFPDNLDKWCAKKAEPDTVARVAAAYHGGLNDLVKEAISLHENNIPYNSAKSILRNYYTLGILNDIKQRLRVLQQENNTLFLSDTTELLNEMIGGAGSPFIYEKTGTRVQHYMMDEFQDTSRMQWENFRPLIEESLASGNFNLIVGDVKQSIYRFRNSDWRLLGEQVNRDFHRDSIREHLLDTNWRSDARVIRFNNAFFTNAACHLQDDFNAAAEEAGKEETAVRHSRQITDAYTDVYQHVAPGKPDDKGQVKITFLKDDKETDWKAEALERLPREIEELQEQGFALNEIAIAVRWNHEAVSVAETLLAYKEQHPGSPYRYDIISNEALLISSARSVKTAIALLRHFQSPNDETLRMIAIYEFYRYHHGSSPEEALHGYREKSPGEFPEAIKGEISQLAVMPFYDMIERFFALTSAAISEKEYAYVQAFLDLALKYKSGTSADRNSFLEWWDEKGCKKALFSPEDQDAIRLITIHKSKGLGFGAVIMPFVNWGVDHSPTHTDIIWCKPRVAPFAAIGVVPLKYGRALAGTIFRDDYLDEKRFTYIDNLNLLYVAFTRAKHRLIVFAPTPAKPETIGNVADLLWRSITGVPPLPDGRGEQIALADYFTPGDDESVFEYGSPAMHESSKKMAARSSGIGQWHSNSFDNRLKLRLNSIGYFSEDGRRDYGRTMHDIISNIKTLADIPHAVAKKITEGELQEEERNEKIEELTRYLSLPEITDWYSGKYTVLNETQLLHPHTRFSRPDRVMLGDGEVIVADYKFGDAKEARYTRQVQRYVNTIKEMGYERVKGFLFYVKLGSVEEVI